MGAQPPSGRAGGRETGPGGLLTQRLASARRRIPGRVPRHLGGGLAFDAGSASGLHAQALRGSPHSGLRPPGYPAREGRDRSRRRRLEGIAPLDAAPTAAAAPPQAAPRSRPGEFARLLEHRLAEPREGIARVRAAIDSIRAGGGKLAPAAAPLDAGTSDPEAMLPYGSQATAGYDPFGWRALSRRLGDELVAPGFGAIFERQIQQESGFDPAVAFGLRTSSAGAEGIAQLMPRYYPAVDRADPQASLVAGARTMRHYLEAFDGDVRRALASYNAGMGRVRSLVAAHGDGWERALPAETRRYLDAILGDARVTVTVDAVGEAAVFGGRGPGGVLTLPLDRVVSERSVDGLLDLLAAAGSAVRAPADGRVFSIERRDGALTILLDHGGGWHSSLQGIVDPLVATGDELRRSDVVGALGETALGETAPGEGRLRFGLTLEGGAVDPRRYLLRV